MDKRYQVFVSSTYADLKNERQKVIQTLMELDCIPAGMELFPAMDEEQFEFIKRVIDDCDYYLLIIGGRYGSVTPEGISYTEKEYDYALEKNLKVVALLHANPDQIPFDKSEQNPELRGKLKTFRDKVSTGRLVKFWNNAEELAGIVALSLSKTIKSFPATGWVRAGKISSEELLTEMNELRKENSELKQALAETKSDIFSPSEEKDFSFIFNKLNRFEDIQLDITQKDSGQLIRKYYSINLGSLLPLLSTQSEHSISSIDNLISNQILDLSTIGSWGITPDIDIGDELLRYGLLIKHYVPPVYSSAARDGLHSLLDSIPRGDIHKLIYTEKLERYKYWLTVNNKMPERIEIHEKET